MTDDGYADWLRANPAPDLQELVARHGGYDKIPPEAWAEYDRAMAAWQERRRTRADGGPSEEIPHSDRSDADPEALCICGLRGVYMRPRKGGGREIWRCEQHRNSWPDYAIEVPDVGKPRADDDERVIERIEGQILEQYQESISDYDPGDDFARSIDEAYAAIRARVRAGGKGWKPR